jgi:hypothetical protein
MAGTGLHENRLLPYEFSQESGTVEEKFCCQIKASGNWPSDNSWAVQLVDFTNLLLFQQKFGLQQVEQLSASWTSKKLIHPVGQKLELIMMCWCAILDVNVQKVQLAMIRFQLPTTESAAE